MTDDSDRKQPRNPLGPTGSRVMGNIKQLRQARGLTYKDLSDRLERLGRPIPVLGLSRLEKGERRVDVDDLVALALALGVTPNRLLMPDISPASTEVMLTDVAKGQPSRLWEWAQGERHPPLPFEDSHSWFQVDRDPDAAFAVANRPYLTSLPARASLTGDPEPPKGTRELMLAVLTVMRDGLEEGRSLDALASYVRRLVEVLVTFHELAPPGEIRGAVEEVGSRISSDSREGSD